MAKSTRSGRQNKPEKPYPDFPLFPHATGLMDKPIRFEPGFKKPSRKTLRQARQAGGKRMFEADELRQLINAAGQPLRTMILLGINCAFGQSDISSLTITAIDLDAGWIAHPRPKTAVERRCPLWPETVEALREVVGERKMRLTDKNRKVKGPRNDEDEDILFITKYGIRWSRTNKREGTPIDAIAQQFGKRLRDLGLKRPRIQFYAIRHTFKTIAGGSKDQVAVNAVMGHVDSSMAGLYRERISDERLQAVVGTVHAWLFSALRRIL